ncbi:PREDICTED: uncharacterized protein K02A2.6-like [Papilio xuthus]|uniref:RNA-directed DNA polymerase n=1 Tax=Papilio xuthus TaxID=66420 RepID=A0AAJ6Z8P8_PAPXU|nr:PREDICTED: uncharacterized protein K02A2.6-like [Papilio xuthus]XP_013167324.1 PREDICTED: uncharacterized protein K02A2.6-like [Papilio xuthus]
MANQLPPPEKLDIEGNSTSAGLRWEKWKRSLQIYLEATDITVPAKKRAILLVLGGSSLQEIFYNLPGADIEAGENVDIFKVAISKLDEYFLPKQNKTFERHIFRLTKQDEGESFEKFLIKLRDQAAKCKFEKPEEHIIDQILEKSLSSELRRKMLTMGEEITLDKVITVANTLEIVNYQLECYEQKEKNNTNEVNTIKINNTNNSRWTRQEKELNEEIKTSKCTRCGSSAHVSQNLPCPAKDKKCNGCGKLGHYQKCCKTKSVHRKRKHAQNQEKEYNYNKRQRKETTVNSVENEEIQYIFNLNDDATIKCEIGGVKLDMLIDSGCKLNLISNKTWKLLKENKIICDKQVKKPNKILLAYGSKTPLQIEGSFEAVIKANSKTERATIYVIEDGTRNLLGKDTALRLGVLKLGEDVNQDKQFSKQSFPKFKGILIEIPIDPTVKPVMQPYRRTPIPLEEKINMKIKELLDLDIIEEVHAPSSWVSPIVPILKDDGDVRLCVDMRRANSAILRENHPLPCMESLLPRINKAKYFSKLDIKNAFHQVEIHPKSRDVTTFITSNGLYRYKRLMFGITCAPELFQKIMEKMLIKCEGVTNFIDDILIWGRNEREHDLRLAKVMDVLEQNDVLLNEKKCIYKVQTINFLGHELKLEGVKPLPKYIKSISEFRVPRTIEELQSFLGLVNYINKWIPNLATTTEPLKQLLRLKLGHKANIEKYWKKNQNEAFKKLKEILSKIETLGYYDVNDRTQVIADASPVGLGAVLVQIDSKRPRIIAYGNRTLSQCERKYSQTEKEALALIWAIEHFNIFLFGKEFDLITDHKPLEFLFSPKSKPCARVERWVLRLQAYRYNVKYKPGKANIADPLSRLCKYTDKTTQSSEDNYVHQIVELARPCAISMQQIIKESATDQEITNVKNGIYSNQWDESVKSYKIFSDELCFYENILLRGNKIVIPERLRKQVLLAAHEGHPGIVAMKGRLRSKVWWPRIDKDSEQMVKSCKGCTLVSLPNPPAPMKRRELPSEPWVEIAMDLLGPLPNNDYILVIIDYYSRYKEIKITKTITSVTIIKILKELFSRLGYPMSITADNGRQFVSEEFKDFCRECNIKLFNTVPYWPQMNGEVERQNRDIIKRLKINSSEKQEMREALYEYLMMYNSTPHSVTGKTPSELFFKRMNRDKIPMMKDIYEMDNDTEVRDRDEMQKEKGKEYGDRKRRAGNTDLTEGDKVYVKEMEKKNKLSTIFNPTPHVVEKSVGGDVTIRNEETGQRLRRNVVHLKRVEGQWESVEDEANKK